MLKAKIVRSEWSRGRQAANALLVTEATIVTAQDARKPLPVAGTMCCLGFACLASGATIGLSEAEIKEKISNVAFPDALNIKLPGLSDSMDALDFSRDAAAINDDPRILDDKEREEKLVKLARENNWEFEFV